MSYLREYSPWQPTKHPCNSSYLIVLFFQIFSSVYGCGPATGRKWYDKGYRTMADITQAVTDGMKLTEQQAMGMLLDDEHDTFRIMLNVVKETFVKMGSNGWSLKTCLSR